MKFNFISVTNFFGGRSTFFGFWFFVIGAILAFKGKLSGGEYIALAGAIQTLLVTRAIADDYHERNNKNGEEK